MELEVFTPIYTRKDERGLFQEIISERLWDTVIFGKMHAGSEIGNHYHKETLASLYLIQGEADIRIIHVETGEFMRAKLNDGQGIMLNPYTAHSIRFLKESAFLLLKSIPYDPEDTFSYHVQG